MKIHKAQPISFFRILTQHMKENTVPNQEKISIMPPNHMKHGLKIWVFKRCAT